MRGGGWPRRFGARSAISRRGGSAVGRRGCRPVIRGVGYAEARQSTARLRPRSFPVCFTLAIHPTGPLRIALVQFPSAVDERNRVSANRAAASRATVSAEYSRESGREGSTWQSRKKRGTPSSIESDNDVVGSSLRETGSFDVERRRRWRGRRADFYYCCCCCCCCWQGVSNLSRAHFRLENVRKPRYRVITKKWWLSIFNTQVHITSLQLNKFYYCITIMKE